MLIILQEEDFGGKNSYYENDKDKNEFAIFVF